MFVLVLASATLMGCTTSLGESATVTYDVTATPAMEVQRQADMQCAKVDKVAVRRSTNAVGPGPYMRHDDFDCVDRREQRRSN
jgi:hypothetical protein